MAKKAAPYYLAALVMLLLLTGCPKQTHIADIDRNPNPYRNKQIAIAGTVTDSFDFKGHGAFQVDDGTGKIWVLAGNYGIPASGARVGLVGDVVSAVTVGSHSFGTAFHLTQKPHY